MSRAEPTLPARPTLEQVASAAGVSRATVSRVVNGSPKVSAAVLATVNDAIARLGYVPNRAARSLVARHTMAIALVVPEDAHRVFGDPYFADIVQGISDRLDDSEFVLNLQLTHPSSPSEKTRNYLRGGNVDGAIVVSHHAGDHFLTRLDPDLPVVFGGRPMLDDEAPRHAPYHVDADNLGGARTAARHLVGLGRTRIATITGPPDMPAAIDRERGWREVLAEAGLPDHRVARGDFTLEGGLRAGLQVLREHPDLDAIFVASDFMARGALLAFEQGGLRVPQDVAVVGFDNSVYATRGELGLTTIDQHTVRMGHQVADVLLRLMAGEPVEHRTVLATTLVVRDSA
ncbi:MAG: LacI family DNA-binding transcriptional regulator [Phycicoccus sp.]